MFAVEVKEPPWHLSGNSCLEMASILIWVVLQTLGTKEKDLILFFVT